MLLLSAAVGPILYSSIAFAQCCTGALTGIVTAPDGSTLAGVRIQLSRRANQLPYSDTATDNKGRFELTGMAPGTYTLELSSSGWQSKRIAPLMIRTASTIDIKVILSPDASSFQSDHSIQMLDRSVWWGMRFGEFSKSESPNTRTVWSILENQETSTVTDRLDIGGLEAGRPALFSALGASWTENQYNLDGFNVTDPYQPGLPSTNPDFDALTDITVVTAAKPAGATGSGANLLLLASQPPQSFHGATRWFFSSRGLQSNNMDGRLADFGFPGPERLNHLVDGNVELGGQVQFWKVSLPSFLSLSTQQMSKDLGGFDVPIDAHVYRALAKFTPISHGGKSLNLMYAGQHIFRSREGADPRFEPGATTRGNDNFHQFQARWRTSSEASTVVDIGFGLSNAIVSSGIQPDISGTSTVDLPQKMRSGPAPLSFAGTRTRYEANGLVEIVREGFGGSHSWRLGLTFDRSNITNRWDALGSLEQVLIAGKGAEAVRWNTPTTAHQHVQNFALFAHDDWRPLKWLSVPWGLRLDDSVGRAAGADNRIHWTTIEPRAGLVIPLRVAGLVFRASWSRYGHLLKGRYLDFGNPEALGGQVFRWNDAHENGQAEPQETNQLLRVFGGPHSAIDRNLRRPFTDEISLGLEQQFGRHFQLRARFFRRDDHRLIELINEGVPFSSYVPTVVIDPGNDGIPGNSDDQTLTLFNRQASALGKDFLVLTNPSGYRGSYKGVEIEGGKQLSHRWAATASFVAMHSSAPTNPGNSVFENDAGVLRDNVEVIDALGTDPNTLRFSLGRVFFDRGFIGKLTAYYQAPYGIRLGAVAKYYDGLPFGRLLFVENFNQGPFFVRATPRADFGAFRTQFNSTLDLRIARDFALHRSHITFDIDIFNLLNLNKNTVEADLTGPTFEKRVPVAIQAPRLVRLGIEWNF